MTFAPARVTTDATRIAEGGSARFRIVLDGVERDAFVVCWRGGLHAYVNSCRHQSRTLDYGDGRFLEGTTLVCRHHGARYRPDDGRCIEGPCAGASLTPLALERRGSELWCTGRA